MAKIFVAQTLLVVPEDWDADRTAAYVAWQLCSSELEKKSIDVVEAGCPICSRPLKVRLEEGCVPGSCCYRPAENSEEYARIQRRKFAISLTEQEHHSSLACYGHRKAGDYV